YPLSYRYLSSCQSISLSQLLYISWSISNICTGSILLLPVGSLIIWVSLLVPQNTASLLRSTLTRPYGSLTFINSLAVISFNFFSSRLDLPPYSSSNMFSFFVIRISSSLPLSILDSANKYLSFLG